MGLFDWFKPSVAIDDATLARIDHAASFINPLIRQVSGYQQTLAPAVRHAYDYCERLALGIPGPFTISRAAFSSDSLVHALFGSPDDIVTMLATSQCVRDYLAGPTTNPADQCCALLGMRPKIVAGFGTRLSGDVIRRDEPQKTLSFADHTLAEPSPDLESAHRRLADAMFDGLLKSLVAHIDEVRMEHQDLRDAQSIERAKARGAGPEAHTRRLAELQESLRKTVDALQPDKLLHTLETHLATPEVSLRLEPVKLWVDRFGILVEGENEREHADALRFVELTTRDQRRWVVMVVKIEREEARAAFARFDQSRRYIVI